MSAFGGKAGHCSCRFGCASVWFTIRRRDPISMTYRSLQKQHRSFVSPQTVGPSLAYGSPDCMTQSEARAKFPKAHLYWHGREHCWNDRPAFSSSALAAVPAPSSPPAQAAVPALALESGVPLEKIRRALLGRPHTSGSARAFLTTRTRGSAHVFPSTRIDDRRVRIAMSIAM